MIIIKDNKINVGIKYLKTNLKYEIEGIKSSICQLIHNSVEARDNKLTKEDPCKIKIIIDTDSISINDNSGGIKKEIDSDGLFTIEIDNSNLNSGIGMKRAFLTLGNSMTITSNQKSNSRKFIIEPNDKNTNLIHKSYNTKYESTEPEGTKIEITNLEKVIIKEIEKVEFYNKLIRELGYIYRYLINKELLQIVVENKKNNEDLNISAIDIDGQCIDETVLTNNATCYLYKTNGNNLSGVEVFSKDLMRYNANEGKKIVKWNQLSEIGHSYKNCLVVIIDYENNTSIDNIFNGEICEEIESFIQKNSFKFRVNETSIQFSKPINEVEKLKKYYNVENNKKLGEKGYLKLLAEYDDDNDKFK
ncbi:ATP-binding protein [Romboutsia sp. 1001713B170131_170501_G6]|uniref:ATP-binding protein n=1 Tax=Romboutsia sp. 1001713B170131_170501_G6 TaxID=2787108 RepID=UPI0018AA1EA7|nr:ATP-binding protein [Romboutsia sp. 1001713B170131_170501_G6]